jgi:hypothetical protein
MKYNARKLPVRVSLMEVEDYTVNIGAANYKLQLLKLELI